MGQYHYVCNMDKKEFLHPHTMGDGLKLMEFGPSAHGTMLGLALLLACSNGRGGGDFRIWNDPYDDGRKVEGLVPEDNDLAEAVIGRWAGDRIAIIGDYSETDDFPGYLSADPGMNPWHDDRNGGEDFVVWKDISPSVRRVIECDFYAGPELAQRWNSPKEGENPYEILTTTAS